MCAAAIAVSVIKALVPQNSAGACIGIAGAAVMILAVIAPFKGFEAENITRWRARCGGEVAAMSESLQAENRRLEEDIIQERLSAYILQRAEAVGAKCAAVTVMSKQGIPVSARAEAADTASVEKLRRIVTDECGISCEVVLQNSGGENDGYK